MGPPGCDRPDCPELAAPITAPEGTSGPPIASTSLAFSPGEPGMEPGDVPPGSFPPAWQPTIPPELDAQLSGKERRIVWLMVAGKSYSQALDAIGTSPRAALRDAGPPDHLTAALHATMRAIAARAGMDRQWIIGQTVALYRRAVAAEQVLDRKGQPTGEWKMDGATAAKCLSMLAEWCPELTPRKGAGRGLDASDVADLLLEVASRGRPALPPGRARAPGRTLEHDAQAPRIAAPQQSGNSLADQGPPSSSSSVIAQDRGASP